MLPCLQAKGPLAAAFKAMQALLQHSYNGDISTCGSGNSGPDALLACVRLLTSSDLPQVIACRPYSDACKAQTKGSELTRLQDWLVCLADLHYEVGLRAAQPHRSIAPCLNQWQQLWHVMHNSVDL